MNASSVEDVLALIRMEYVEMPCLKLTLTQARRLFNLSEERCASALDNLVSAGFLARTRDGAFRRRSGADLVAFG